MINPVDFLKQIQKEIDNIEELDYPQDHTLDLWIKQARDNDTKLSEILSEINVYLDEYAKLPLDKTG